MHVDHADCTAKTSISAYTVAHMLRSDDCLQSDKIAARSFRRNSHPTFDGYC